MAFSPNSSSARSNSRGSPESSPGRLASFSKASSTIGSCWSVELSRLRSASSFFEAMECLRNISELLLLVDSRDRVRFCQTDFESSVRVLKRQRQIWSDDLFREVTLISLQFFNRSAFRVLPSDVILHIFLFLPVRTFSMLPCVSQDWRLLSHGDQVWSLLYHQKFLRSNPGPLPALRGSSDSYMAHFAIRLQDPQVGDKVEVAWKGKFRLETQDVYQGLAWWLAEVVDKAADQTRYRIRYPGWESRWDEWVPRCRLRWTVARNALDSICAGDVVELWCCGANVPGAWLESKVKRVRHGRYCLGRVLSTGYLWVERDRIRLVRRAAEGAAGTGSVGMVGDLQRGTSFSAISQRLRRAISDTSASCTIM